MNNIKAIATYPESLLAALDQKKLENAGIPAEVFHHQADSAAFTGVSSASLMVAEQDLERATIFLNSHVPKPGLASQNKWRVSCPECTSKNIHSKASWWSLFGDYMIFDFWMFGIKRKKDRHACNDCGHHWRIWFGRG